MPDVDWQTCELCRRQVPPHLLTLHHLKPKQKGGKAEDRTPLCRPCHKQVHAVFGNTDLAKNYASIARLRESPLLKPFLRWIEKQKPDRNFKTVLSNDHPQARRRRRK